MSKASCAFGCACLHLLSAIFAIKHFTNVYTPTTGQRDTVSPFQVVYDWVLSLHPGTSEA